MFSVGRDQPPASPSSHLCSLTPSLCAHPSVLHPFFCLHSLARIVLGVAREKSCFRPHPESENSPPRRGLGRAESSPLVIFLSGSSVAGLPAVCHPSHGALVTVSPTPQVKALPLGLLIHEAECLPLGRSFLQVPVTGLPAVWLLSHSARVTVSPRSASESSAPCRRV